MAKNKTMNLEDFKNLVSLDNDFKEEIIGRNDLIDLDNGVMRIYSEHLPTYLEKYSCKNAEDLEDTLYYCYGIFCTVID